MEAAGQSAVLREFFSVVYGARKPIRLAVPGCTTGGDFRQIDPAVTEMVVGVDINRDYLELARKHFSALGPRLVLIHGDVLTAQLPPVQFELVHAALLLEYVDPAALFRRIYQWLRPGGTCSVITQDPAPGVAQVSSTGYESLQVLGRVMSLRSALEVDTVADQTGFRFVRRCAKDLPKGKRLVHSLFEKTEGGDQDFR